MHSPLRRYLTTAHAAALLSVTVDKILDLIHAGHLPAVDVSLHRGGKARWRISTEDLESFLASRRTLVPAVRTTGRKEKYLRKYY